MVQKVVFIASSDLQKWLDCTEDSTSVPVSVS